MYCTRENRQPLILNRKLKRWIPLGNKRVCDASRVLLNIRTIEK